MSAAAPGCCVCCAAARGSGWPVTVTGEKRRTRSVRKLIHRARVVLDWFFILRTWYVVLALRERGKILNVSDGMRYEWRCFDKETLQ